MTASRKPHPDDIEAGARVRFFRNQRGISQESLAAKLGVTFQQIQKYEKGTNRIGVARLKALARALEVKPSDIIDSIEDGTHLRPIPAFAPKTMEFARKFDRLDPRQRHAVAAVIDAALSLSADARCPNTIEMFPGECAA